MLQLNEIHHNIRDEETAVQVCASPNFNRDSGPKIELQLTILKKKKICFFFLNCLKIYFSPEIQVELAIMQMCHQGINFHAKGFFVINYATMLQVLYFIIKNRKLSHFIL